MKFKRLWIILALSLVMIIALFRLGNIELSWATFQRVHWSWYALVVVSYYVSVVARGWRWQTILRAMDWPIGFVYANTLLIAGLFLNAILPARAGDIGRVVMLRQDHRIPVAHSLASIASERALDVFSLLLLALLGGWLALPGKIPAEVLQFLGVMAVLLVLGVAGLLVIPGAENWLREWRLLKQLLPARLWAITQKILDFGFALINGIRALANRPLALGLIIAQSFFVWIWDGLMVYFILLSLGLVQPFSVSLFGAMVGALATAVPLTPGALGQFDAVLMGLLALFDISTADAGLTVLLLRLVQLWTFIPVAGAITYIFGFARALNLGKMEEELPVNEPANQRVSESANYG